jgi:carbon storage regulator
MLVLYRRSGESIVLGRDLNEANVLPEITIKVLSNDGNHVRIGIDAPRDVLVHRQEFLKKIQIFNQENEPQKKT